MTASALLNSESEKFKCGLSPVYEIDYEAISSPNAKKSNKHAVGAISDQLPASSCISAHPHSKKCDKWGINRLLSSVARSVTLLGKRN